MKKQINNRFLQTIIKQLFFLILCASSFYSKGQTIINNVCQGDSINVYLTGLCPATDGLVVYTARTLYNLMYNTSEVFTDNCGVYDTEDGKISNNERQRNNNKLFQQSIGNSDFKIIPNPSNGSFSITSNLPQQLQISILSIDGKLLVKEKTEANSLINASLNEGIYILIIEEEATHTKSIKKLIIQTNE